MYQYGEKVIQQRQRWVLDLKANLAARHFQNRLATVPLTVRTRLSFPIPTWQSSAPEFDGYTTLGYAGLRKPRVFRRFWALKRSLA